MRPNKGRSDRDMNWRGPTITRQERALAWDAYDKHISKLNRIRVLSKPTITRQERALAWDAYDKHIQQLNQTLWLEDGPITSEESSLFIMINEMIDSVLS